MSWTFFYPATTAYREVGPADVPAFHAVMLQAGMDPRSSWNRTTLSDLEHSLFGPGAGGYLAVTDEGRGVAVGCVGYRPDGPATLTLNKLATLPLARSQGVGRRLVERVEQRARQGGYSRVLLAVSQYNLSVLPFYLKLGYQVSAERYAHAHPSSPPPVVLVRELE